MPNRIFYKVYQKMCCNKNKLWKSVTVFYYIHLHYIWNVCVCVHLRGVAVCCANVVFITVVSHICISFNFAHQKHTQHTSTSKTWFFLHILLFNFIWSCYIFYTRSQFLWSIWNYVMNWFVVDVVAIDSCSYLKQ